MLVSHCCYLMARCWALFFPSDFLRVKFTSVDHSVYINIVPHKALASVLISKNLAELAAEGS